MKLSINYALPSLKEKAMALSLELGLPIDKQSKTALYLETDRLCLAVEGFSPLWIDFSDEQWCKRKSEGKKQGLVKACKPVPGLQILDLTAGWGRDAAVLASFGAELLMLERHPVMAALLEDAIKRCRADEQCDLNLSLLAVDAKDYLQELQPSDYPDVIYMDPMHPLRQKSALVKKDLQILQTMVGPDEDALEVLTLAKQRVKQRVVIKWPQKQPPLARPNASIEGKTVRFDIFLPERK